MPAVHPCDTGSPAGRLRPAALARVDGQAITLRSLEEAVAAVEAACSEGRGFALYTLNLDHLVKLRHDQAFRAAYGTAEFVTADGWPIVRLARGEAPGLERTTGSDLVVPLCRMAAARGLPVYLLGTTQSSLDQAAERLIQLCPGLIVAGTDAPPPGFDPRSEMADASAARIARSGARLCFVALGAPKQELFAAVARAHCPSVGFLGIGAALDFIAGTQNRAPPLIRRLNLEWAWRLVGAPRRLGPRYLRCAILFARLLVAARARPGAAV